MSTTRKPATKPATSRTLEERDAQIAEDELLKGVPALKPATAFRQRDRSNLLKLGLQLSDVAGEDGEVDENDPRAAAAMLDLLADADEFFESIAVDRDAYVAWSEGLEHSEQVFSALIAKYTRAVGE
ncbi:hypothetical protein [Puerhibacterium puerhi]|uniref:hypothetical protein n=1 Tax=Puerhibacterium puerhi TaxID=2692623 RepID=UPI001358DB49|nr:hypothetical protein [Puerhibacterium puerhi]